nr:TIGR03905 family TSCPD domain-containing protein [Eubacterium sp.]
MKFSYKTKGTCAQQIDLEINGDVITNVKFYGGCDGNLKAIPILVDGLTVDQIHEKCSGIQCGFKDTSCADQLAKAVVAAREAAAQS